MSSPRIPALLVLNDPHSLRICGELAVEIGFQASVVLLQLEYLVRISSTKEYEGNIWTYQSLADLKCGHFPWWEESTISRILDSLFDKKLILYGNFNKNRQDRTRWYALNWPEISNLKSVRVDESILQNAKWLRRKPIPRGQDELPNLENPPGILQDGGGILQNRPTKPLKWDDVTRDSSRDFSETSSEIPGLRANIFDPQEVWSFVLGQLQAEMGRADFETYVKPVQVRGIEGSKFIVEVANPFVREWIVNRLKRTIERILSGSIGAECELVVLLPGENRLVCARTLKAKR